MGGEHVLVQGSNEMETELMNRSKRVHGEIYMHQLHTHTCSNYAYVMKLYSVIVEPQFLMSMVLLGHTPV